MQQNKKIKASKISKYIQFFSVQDMHLYNGKTSRHILLVHAYCFTWLGLDGWLVVGSFMSLQDQRSSQDGHQLVTARSHGDFIMLTHWEIRLPAPCPDIPPSHIILTLS